jgi:DNA-binding transcriptional MocR family regulator
MPEPKKEELVALLRRHGVPLIEDDVYAELHLGPRPTRPAKAFDRDGDVLHCSSFSKTLAPGYRIGWVVAGRRAEALRRLKLTTSLASPFPTQAALADYLEHGGFDRHLRRLREALALQRSSLLRALYRHFPKGTRATSPLGGYFVWVELPEGADALALHAAALEHGISVAPGPMFSAHRGFRRCIRLNYGHPWEPRMDRAMATLGRLVAGRAR